MRTLGSISGTSYSLINVGVGWCGHEQQGWWEVKIIESLNPQKLPAIGHLTKGAWCYRDKKCISIHIETMAGTVVSTKIRLGKLKKWVKP